MKTECSFFQIVGKTNKLIAQISVFNMAMLFSLFLFACSNSDNGSDQEPKLTGEVMGSVKDGDGNPYPNTLITIKKGTETTSRGTNELGEYSMTSKDIGSHSIDIQLPLSTELIGNTTSTVNVQANQASTVNFVVQPQSLMAHLNFGSVQLIEEIVDKDGNTPTNPNEPLFAKNIFDAPLGQLNEIKAPDGHQVILSEFKLATGNFLVTCDGNSSTVQITLGGMIPNGTYTFWLAYLNKIRKVGEDIDFANDFVNMNNPPIGASDGSENVLIADANGRIDATLTHGSCILTDQVALVIPVLYHLNGKTFGGGHVPDAEEMVHMLVYFQ